MKGYTGLTGLPDENEWEELMTLAKISDTREKVLGMQISNEAKLRFIMGISLIAMSVSQVSKRNRKRFRKRMIAARHRVNGVLNLADNTLRDEIFAALEGTPAIKTLGSVGVYDPSTKEVRELYERQ